MQMLKRNSISVLLIFKYDEYELHATRPSWNITRFPQGGHYSENTPECRIPLFVVQVPTYLECKRYFYLLSV